MKKFMIPLALLVAGCGAPKVDVKKQWTDAIHNFSLVPLYPMREDVFVGDVRIHKIGTDARASGALESRMLYRLGDGEQKFKMNNAKAPHYPKGSAAEPVTVQSGQAPPPRFSAQPGGDEAAANTAGASSRLRLATLPGYDGVRITEANATWNGVSGLWKFMVDGKATCNLRVCNRQPDEPCLRHRCLCHHFESTWPAPAPPWLARQRARALPGL